FLFQSNGLFSLGSFNSLGLFALGEFSIFAAHMLWPLLTIIRKLFMVIEHDVAVVVEEDEDLTSIYVGGIWDEFKNLIPAPQSKLLTKGFNLIIVGSIPEMDFSN